jgi:hypothetical protein
MKRTIIGLVLLLSSVLCFAQGWEDDYAIQKAVENVDDTLMQLIFYDKLTGKVTAEVAFGVVEMLMDEKPGRPQYEVLVLASRSNVQKLLRAQHMLYFFNKAETYANFTAVHKEAQTYLKRVEYELGYK